VTRWARAFVAQVWEGWVLFGRLSAGERPEEKRETRQKRPGHPECVPHADDGTPESVAFWALVRRMNEDETERSRSRRSGGDRG
jgi:hypothetical protein